MYEVHLERLPEVAERLELGALVALTGTVYLARDAGHMRLLGILERTGELPEYLVGATLFYAGPTPERGGLPFGAIGPTTASRMDAITPRLLDAGVAATIGKGMRSTEVAVACARNRAPYFAAVGGAAALLARHIATSEIIAWPELGTEALRRVWVEGLPVYVAIDARGADLYREIAERSSR